MSAIDSAVPTLAIGPGNSVQVFCRGRIICAAVRNGHGWMAHVDSRMVEAPTIDALLIELKLLSDHHRGRS
jgi:hypothetical protein